MLLLFATAARAQTFTATLSGANGVPPGGQGSGTATFTFAGTTVNYSVTVFGLRRPIVAHIHQGPPGANGPIVVDFDFCVTCGPPPPPDIQPVYQVQGNITASAATINAIIADPSDYYLDVANPDLPEAAFRGQLAPAATTSEVVPTTSVFGLIVMTIVLAAAGILISRRA
jgi:hypothetical protein